MGAKTYIWLALSIVLLLTPTGQAQDEQWLQYHCEREAQHIISDMGTSMPEVTSDKPTNVQLPDFICDDPFFAFWPTPMITDGGLWIAFDRQKKNGQPYDLIYIDSNADGNLVDESAVKCYEFDYRDSRRSKFGLLKVIFEGEDGPITYHLNIEFYKGSSRQYLYITSAGWYEGTIDIAGTKKHCVLIDYNVNGTFNDKSLNPTECDRIRIGKKGEQDTRYVGNFIEIDNVLYRPEIAQDGAYVKLTKAEDVKFGNIRLPQAITEFSAGGENGLFKIKLENGIGSLPVGKYRINQWAIEREDEKRRKWKLQGEGASDKGDFDIVVDKKTELSIGEPIISKLQVNKRDSGYSFNQSLEGQHGERIELTRNGSQPPAPKLHIKNKNGTYDRSFSFEYG
jgi:hypothetical protein